MRDLLPRQVRRRRFLQAKILQTFESFGFEQIETPVVEELDRLIGSEGGDNAKLIYKILERRIDWSSKNVTSDDDVSDLGLRYDLTVPLARFFATNQAELPTPFKSIQIGSAFRAERPQRGRYRQFTQCDIDIIGDRNVIAEAELVTASATALIACGLQGFSLRMNHRKLLDALLQGSGFMADSVPAALVVFDKLDKIGLEKVGAELAEIDANASTALVERVTALSGAVTVDEVQSELGSVVPSIVFDELREIEHAFRVSAPTVPIVLDVSLVRGQGYYTGPIFEFTHAEMGGSLGGGGRYDNMIEKLSGIDAPATGMSIGFERLDLLLEEREITGEGNRIVLLYDQRAATSHVMKAAAELRATGAVVRTEMATGNRRAQLDRLTKAGFTHHTSLPAGSFSAGEVTQLTGDASS